MPYYKFTYFYNNHSQVILSRYFLWYNGNWDLVRIYSNTYNSDQNLDTALVKDWNESTQESSELWRWYYNYNSSKNLDSWIFQINEVSGWRDVSSNTFDYNSSGYLEKQSASSWDPISQLWRLMSEASYDYGTLNNVETYSSKQKDPATLQWKNESKIEYIYDSSTLLSDISHPPFSDFYVLGELLIPNNAVLTEKRHHWNGLSWEVNRLSDYYYSTQTIGKEEISLEQIDLYPNPATNRIEIHGANSQEYRIQLISMNGLKVLDENFVISLSISIDHIPNGMYLAKIESANSISTKRLIIAR
jgi:hypothetical protein